MKNKLLVLSIIWILILSLFVVQLIGSQNETPPGTPSPQVPGGEINPDTGLPKGVEVVQEVVENFSDNKLRNQNASYFREELWKMIEKNNYYQKFLGFYKTISPFADPVLTFLLGMPPSLNWFFILTLIIWITLFIFVLRITAIFEISSKIWYILAAIGLMLLYSIFKIPKAIAGNILAVISLFNIWWVQLILIGLVIVALILAMIFSKELKVLWKAIKEKNKKNMEELQQLKMKKDLAALDELRKVLEK